MTNGLPEAFLSIGGGAMHSKIDRTAWPLILCAVFLGGVVLAAMSVLPATSALSAVLKCLSKGCATDLKAQWSMAYAAWAMVIVSALGTAIGGFTLWFVYKTLEATRLAAKAAEDSAGIARNALTQQVETGKQQIRCYPSISRITVRREFASVLIKVVVANSGKTPAQNVRVKCTGHISLKEIETPQTFEMEESAFVGILGQDVMTFEVPAPLPTAWQDKAAATVGVLSGELFVFPMSVSFDLEFTCTDIFGSRISLINKCLSSNIRSFSDAGVIFRQVQSNPDIQG